MQQTTLPEWFATTPAGRELAAQADLAVRDQRSAAIAELLAADETHAVAVAPLRESRPKAAKRLDAARRELEWATAALAAIDGDLASADARRDKALDRADRVLTGTLPPEEIAARRALDRAFQRARDTIPVTYHSPARTAPHGPAPAAVRVYDVGFAEARVAEVRAAGERLTQACRCEPDPAVVRQLALDVIQTFGGAQ